MNNLKDLKVYFDLMLANGVANLYKIVQEMQLLHSYTPEDRFSAEDLAAKHQFVLGPTKVLLETLVTVGMVEKHCEQYAVSKVMHLLKGNYQNLSSEYWAHLPSLLKSGTPFKKMDTVENSEREYQVQVKSLEWMMTPSAHVAVKMLSQLHSDKPINEGPLKILDVGAGSGVWSFNFLYHNKQATCTLADWPAVLAVAKDTAQKHSITERVKYIEGNFHQTDFGSDLFDYAILGNVTHIQSPEENKRIFKKIAERLSSDGRLIIFDAYGDVPHGALSRALYQMGLTIRTVQGQVYYPDTMKPWLIEVGFKTFEFHSLDIVPYSMGMLIAKK